MKNVDMFQVVNVVEDIYRHDSTNSNNEDVYEDWEHVILQTLKDSPLKVEISRLKLKKSIPILILHVKYYDMDLMITHL